MWEGGSKCQLPRSSHFLWEALFISIGDHTWKALVSTVLAFLNEYGIDINNTKEQSYDNPANTSGCYNGLQSHISNINNLTIYIPCAAHSLNLVGVSAAGSCNGAISSFRFVQALHNFLSASTHRWAIMIKCLGQIDQSDMAKHELVLKKVNDTRWSARADETKALSKGYSTIQKTLQTIAGDNS